MLTPLYTREGINVGDMPWNEYPRPSLVREKWVNLNGIWEFSANGGEFTYIRVPFCPESLLSGVHETYPDGARLVYRREFAAPEHPARGHVLLHIGAADQTARVYVNGEKVCEHEGGYLPFEADITRLLRDGANEVRLEADDLNDPVYPRGKQKVKRGGMWYTPVSGIWQSVWLESVPETYITSLSVTCDERGADIIISGADTGTLLCGGREYPIENGHVRVEPENARLWSPEDPYLYRFTVKCGEDEVKSYFALRTLSVRRVNGYERLCLNGEPYFFHALLDQGYYSDGLLTPAGEESYRRDILTAKELGFNTLRKHIKIEPEVFYYECDRLGMVVFQDMVNNGSYSFLRDTALPTIGLQSLRDRYLNRDARTRAFFRRHMRETVLRLKNHPCICLWTVFNEGWGQFCADDMYRELRSLDPTRFIDAASGWFRQSEGDTDSRHIYFKPLRMKAGKKPLYLSEYGGYVWKDAPHSANRDKTYGYRICKTREDFVRDLKRLLDEVTRLAGEGLCAAVYTQLSDVEDETNGLMTYDRETVKVTKDEIAPYGERLRRAVREEKENEDNGRNA